MWNTVLYHALSITHINKFLMIFFTIVLQKIIELWCHSHFLNWLRKPWIQVGQLPTEINFYHFKSPNLKNQPTKRTAVPQYVMQVWSILHIISFEKYQHLADQLSHYFKIWLIPREICLLNIAEGSRNTKSTKVWNNDVLWYPLSVSIICKWLYSFMHGFASI